LPCLEITVGGEQLRGDAARILLKEELQDLRCRGRLAGTLKRFDHPHCHGLGKCEVGSLAILSRGSSEIAAQAQGIADQHMRVRNAQIVRLKP
jgi:hypothetical protein